MKIFVDSDVILDVLLQRNDFHRYSSLILELAINGELLAYTSAVVLSNVHYILRKRVSKDDTIANLRFLTQTIQVVPITHNAAQLALESGFPDFEDAMQNFAAKEADVDILLTRNIKDYPDPDLEVLSPRQFISEHGILWGLQ
jgi:predicted nucleic acid-binding protein